MIEERVAEILGRSAARHPGLVVGVHADRETGVWSRGVEPDAVFEIGSITKTFTATVLASMLLDGLVALDDPVARHLPVAPPVVGREITLEDLATHRSGLPRLPSGLLLQGYTSGRKDPYALLDDARMRQAIAETKPKRAPGGKVAYSNYGYGLLGYALAQPGPATPTSAQRITSPLGLHRHRARHARPDPGPRLLRARPRLAPRVGGRRRRAALDRPRHARYLAIHAPTARWPRRRRDPGAAADGRARVGLGWVILPAGSGPKWVGSSTRP